MTCPAGLREDTSTREVQEQLFRKAGADLDRMWVEGRGPHALSRTVTADMYDRYLAGLSLAQVAAEFGVTRQAVYDRLKRAGKALRPRTFCRRHVKFGGRLFTPTKGGYYRASRGDRRMLHHAVWEAVHGPIPPGHEVFIDGPKDTTDASRLRLVARTDRSHLAGDVELRWCEQCGFLIPRKHYRPKAYSERRFCSPRCKGLASRGRRRGA